MSLRSVLFTLIFSIILFAGSLQERPVLYILGDSTVASASDGNPIQGWGKLLMSKFDTSAIVIRNLAVSGTSSRTYYSGIVHDKKILKDKLWSGTLKKIRAGDYVMLQFGHNDESPVIDTSRMRGSLKGAGNDSLTVTNSFSKQREVVYSYGGYLKKFIDQIHAKNAFAIICSPIPKNKWLAGRVIRNDLDYGKWAKEAAAKNGAAFIDLNKLVADEYDELGKDKVAAEYFVADGIHTTKIGAELNAVLVARAIKNLSGLELKRYLKP